MAVRQYQYVLGADKVTVRASKSTVGAPGGGVVVRVIVDDGAAGPGGKTAIATALRMIESVVREQDLPAA